ncbi:mitochondrial carrier domain-containing protein [Lipomyces tetrasporus]|uniref:Mitochondrial carrier domain-containing protein n=1 Tax=Lipomyces tetrasporus TaxID=54092 RepID=A0AAD7QUI6_9ASCO|nr:mitochondrial carrier domain-containing protein [Lipomyces tetrasporus]KAJ8101758.1 mitochondrial carrier domain-containing protein [Lipomyces tetrasporus]
MGSLRPYYQRPELVFHNGVPDLAITKAGNGTSSNTPDLGGGGLLGLSSSRADSILADLDYADYLELPNTSELVRGLTNAMLTRYSSTFLAQPFEVAKMVLQCGKYDRLRTRTESSPSMGTDSSATKKGSSQKRGRRGWMDDIDTFEIDDLDDEVDEVQYFSTLGESSSRQSVKPKRAGSVSSSGSAESSSSRGSTSKRSNAGWAMQRRKSEPAAEIYQIGSHRPYLLGAMGALWTKDGPWGVWRGTNVTFVQNIMFTTLESWLSAFFSAVLSLPDPALLEIADSSHPLVSLVASVAATTLTALVLSPLDIVRTKLILTPSDAQPRSIVASLQCLPSLTCPSDLLLPTTLLAAVPKLISRGTPYLLRTKWGIEQYTTPMLFSVLSLASSVTELFVRLPLETVLRRGQLAYVGVQRAMVPVGSYNGMFGTIWEIISSEDNGDSGLEGLWRGWRVGMLGIFGTWGFGGLRSRTLAYSGREERF